MHRKTLTFLLATLGLIVGAVPTSSALAQERHQGGGQHGGGDRHAGGDRGRGRDWRGERSYRRNGYDGGPGFGIVIGTYGGRPFYCRNHRHWRWSNRQQRYVYAVRGRC